jgi:hypothetical protein
LTDWRDLILREFAPGAARLTLVADPDQLMTEEGILQGIQERGFDVVRFENPMAFRYVYESRYRAHWDQGETAWLVVVLQAGSGSLSELPYDLLQTGRQLTFSLGDIFPDLSYQVVAGLDRDDLSPLYEAYVQEQPGVLGTNATVDFVLRRVFLILPETVTAPEDLLRVLLRKHYRRQRIPEPIEQRLVQLLSHDGRFADWSLATLMADREAFLRFLQERWPAYLDQLTAGEPSKAREVYHFTLPGPAMVPFDDADVRVYIDNLFREGWLKPVAHDGTPPPQASWVDIGMQIDPTEGIRRQRDALAKSIAQAIPQPEARHREWLSFAWSWAQLIALNAQLPEESGTVELQAQVDNAFARWLEKRYAGLHNQPPNPPVMVHHVPRVLAEYRQQHDERIALVVVDGLALDQWIAVRETLLSKDAELQFEENAIFAWAPTVTSVSRQALFAGKCPLYFPASIHDTKREDRHWSLFWETQGVQKDAVRFVKGLGEPDSLSAAKNEVGDSRCRVIALVVDKVDRIMHGMELGSAGMHNQVRQWTEQGFLLSLLKLLLSHDFRVFLTSDHGNLEAQGCGCPSEGSLADTKGERVRIYSDPVLRARVKATFPDAIEWPAIGLPESYYPLLAPTRAAFVRPGATVVSHGGVSLEELIVPVIRIELRRG